MAARAMPAGKAVPEKHGKSDVKETAESSTADVESTEVETASTTDDSAEADVEVDENDLKELEDAKKVPFKRFKEVNDKAKSYQEQLAQQQARYEAELKRVEELAEIRVKARQDKERQSKELDELDPYDRADKILSQKVEELESRLSRMTKHSEESDLKNSINSLKSIYPEADEIAVLGWKRAQPGKDLEELMAMSHNRQVDRDQQSLKNLIEKKKQRAKAAIPTREGGIRLKESEKPKNLKEAHALVRRLMGAGK